MELQARRARFGAGTRADGNGLHQRIHAVVRRIPKGRVATYGQVALLAGLPRQARLVGYALNALPEGSRVPWHRVVNAQGRISLRSGSGGHHYQRHLLEEEDVVFDGKGVLSLSTFQWPRGAPANRRRPAASVAKERRMKLPEVMKELKTMGTAQNRKVYARHGVGESMFGVSYADLGKLAKRIKTDHDLAIGLWESGNHDARVLATMVADPAAVTSRMLDAWCRELDNYILTDAFSGLAARTSFARKKMDLWIRSEKEWTARSGWNLVGQGAMRDAEIPDGDLEIRLRTVEARIHKSKNRVRDAMNGALIAIGMRNANLEKKALAAAGRIGKVDVDHGETGCKTPDAAAYILKAKARGRKGSRG